MTLSKGQKVSVTLTALSGKRLRGLAKSSKIAFTVLSPKAFRGKRSVKVRVSPAAKTTGRVTGRIYALVR